MIFAHQDSEMRYQFDRWITELAGGYPLGEYIPLLRTCNSMKRGTFYIETTLYDMLHGLIVIHNSSTIDLYSRNARSTPRPEDSAFMNDGFRKNNTQFQVRHTAGRLHHDVLYRLRKIMRGRVSKYLRRAC